MESLTQIQLLVLCVEGALVIAGVLIWIFGSMRVGQLAPEWDVPVTNTLMLAWAVLFGGFLGQLIGIGLLRAFPAEMRVLEVVQVLVLGSGLHGGLLAGWFAVHTFVRRNGHALPLAIERPIRVSDTARAGVATLLRVLPVVMGVGFLWGMVLQGLGIPVEQQDLVGVFARADSPVALAGLVVLAIVIVPISEELIFRAGIFRILKGRIGRWPAIAVSSTLFALLHGSWVGFAPLFCLGALFCIAYERSRSVAVPMIAHGLFNLNSILMIVLAPVEFLQ